MDNNDNKLQMNALNAIWHRIIYFSNRNKLNILSSNLKEVTTLEISIVSLVEKNPNIILKEIVQELQIPSSTLTSAVDRLEKRGLIKRIISERDRRSYGLQLTEKGMLVQEEHEKGEQYIIEAIFSALDNEEERATFVRLASKIADHIIKTESQIITEQHERHSAKGSS